MSESVLLGRLLGSSFADAREDAREALSARMVDRSCRDVTDVVCGAWEDVVVSEREMRSKVLADPALLDADGEERAMLLLLLEAFDAAEVENVSIMGMVDRARRLGRRDRARLNGLLESGLKLSEALERV